MMNQKIIDYAVNELGFVGMANPLFIGSRTVYKKDLTSDSYLKLDGEYMYMLKREGNIEIGEVIDEKITSVEVLKDIVNKYKQCN